MSRLSREVAEASRALDKAIDTRISPIFRKPTTGNALVDSAKRVQRLSTKAKHLRKQLKAVEQDIKLEKKHLRALCQEVANR